MRYTFFIAPIFFTNALTAQIDTNLYYKVDTIKQLYGIVNSNGAPVIPMKYDNWFGYEDGELCNDSFITVFLDSITIANFRKLNATALVGTTIFDRKGNLLTFPYWYDNGADFVREGKYRIVDINTGKMGFANEKHEIVILPQWDFVSPFNYGYATIFTGYERKYVDEHKEHWTIVPKNKASKTAVINHEGKIINGSVKKQHDDDYWNSEDSLYYPNPFIYNDKEKRFVDSINDLSVIFDLYYMNHYGVDKKTAQFHILERPNEHNPNYILALYDHQYLNDLHLLKYDAENTQLWYYDFYYQKENPWKPFKEYILDRLFEAKDYFKSYPHAENKFDVEKYISQFQ